MSMMIQANLREIQPLLADSIDQKLQNAILVGNLTDAVAALEKGADISGKQLGVPPLLLAAIRGRREIAAVLLDRGADPNIANKNMMRQAKNPLVFATVGGYLDIVTKILDRGVDPNCSIIGNSGLTALHYAALLGHRDLVVFLLERGANPNLANQDGRKPIDLARGEGKVNIVSLLEMNSALPLLLNQLVELAESGNLQQFDAVLNANPIELTSFKHPQSGDTLLHALCKKGRVDAVNIVLNRGVNINALNKDGKKPMDCAREGEHTAIIALLDRMQAIYQMMSATPLYQAALNGHRDTTAFLLKQGADPNIANNKGVKPINAAIGNRHAVIVSLLTKWAVLCKLFDLAVSGDLQGFNAHLNALSDASTFELTCLQAQTKSRKPVESAQKNMLDKILAHLRVLFVYKLQESLRSGDLTEFKAYIAALSDATPEELGSIDRKT
eukprot:gene24366-32811_t